MTDGRSWILAHEIAGALNLAYTQVDTTYQELDLSKMNREGNYQSLRVNLQVMTTTNMSRQNQRQRCGEQLPIFSLNLQ
jgi:uncharacterized membrane protein YukC